MSQPLKIQEKAHEQAVLDSGQPVPWVSIAQGLVESSGDKSKPAMGWLLQGVDARHALDMAKALSLQVKNPSQTIGTVCLDLNKGFISLDDTGLYSTTPRSLYDKMIKQADQLPVDSVRVLIIHGIEQADFGHFNMLRSHLLEEPRRFDGVVYAVREAFDPEDALFKRLASLCQEWSFSSPISIDAGASKPKAF
jgi:hypothetical protein